MEILDILTFMVIGVFSLLISGYIGYVYIKQSHYLEDLITNGIENIINDAQNNETMQKQLYTIGALLGNGIASGSGMKSSAKGGRLSLNNLIAEIASNWIQKSVNNPSPSPSEPIPSTYNQEMNKVKSW